MAEIFSQIWVWVASVAGGITLAGVVTAIIYGCLKGAFNRAIAKINVKKISEEATEKGIEKVRKVSFTHSIQPIVESELEKVNEKSQALIKSELEKTQEGYDKLLNVVEKLAAYFENSIGVSDKAKEDLREALKEARSEKKFAESYVESEVIAEEPKKTEDPKTFKKQVKVER